VDSGGTGFSVQWLFNGAPIPGAIITNLTVTNLTLETVGHYSLRVTKGAYTVETLAANLQINLTGTETQPVRAFDKFLDLISSGQFLLLGEPGGSGGAVRAVPAALSRGYSGTQVFNTYGGTTEAGEPNHCGIIGGASAWFAVQADVDGVLHVNTDGSDFDTVLAVYAATGAGFEDLNPVACDDNSGLDGIDSALALWATAGEVYFIAVDGAGGATGVVTLNYSLVIPARLRLLERLPSGAVHLEVSGEPEVEVELQSSPDLADWSTLLLTNTSTGLWEWIDSACTNLTRCYYRALTRP